jgi:type II secretory pathway component GspD/PulD (secretin)
MSRQGGLVGRRIAIPILGALLTAALIIDLAWSQSPSGRGSFRIAQAPLNGPEFTPAQLPPSASTEPSSRSGEARFLSSQRASNAPTREAIAPLEQENLQEYTVPMRQPSDGMVLESEDGLISLVARDASLRDVLTALAETQGLNLITEESVDAQINTTLHRVPFRDVLDVILSTSGYTWVRNRNVIQVTNISNSKKLAPETQGRQVEVFQLDFVSATDVNSVVQTMLSPAGSSNVIESSPEDNRRTQEILVVQDLPGYLENIRNYLDKHDVPPRQVLVEAYILKVELSDDMRHGVNFDHVFNMSNNLFRIESRGLANAATTQGFMVHLSGGNLAAVVEMLENTTDAKTLASPKIRVLNGQTARIQVGEQLGFRVTTTTETSTTESVEFLDVGVVLEVTPRIGSDGTVVMRVSPEVSSGRVNPTTGLPEEETTELQTDVMFRDNQAYVIGGLIQEADVDVRRKLPWLGDLKHLGHLFQRSEVLKRRSEVIVALLPRVMPFDPETNDELLLETDRSMTPLLYGPLIEYPRPWEAQLPHVVRNPKLLRLPLVLGAKYSKGEERGLPQKAIEPIEAVKDQARATGVLREYVPPVVTTSRRPDSRGAIGPLRMTRLPQTNLTQPVERTHTAERFGAVPR